MPGAAPQPPAQAVAQGKTITQVVEASDTLQHKIFVKTLTGKLLFVKTLTGKIFVKTHIQQRLDLRGASS
jgi:hypothetical protein